MADELLTIEQSESEDESPILLGQRLLDFKNKDEVMSQWSNIEYGFFLWSKYGNPENPNEAGSDPDNDPTVNLPPLPKVKPAEIKGGLVNITRGTSNEKREKATRPSTRKRDYIYGQDKYIEVKATRLPYTPNPSFIISANEFTKGCELKEQYYICWVFSAASEQPKYKYIQNPFGNPDKFSIVPRSYEVGYKFE